MATFLGHPEYRAAPNGKPLSPHASVRASDSWNLLVFRDGGRVLDGPELLRILRQKLNNLFLISDCTLQSAREALIETLLRSGELESVLADCAGCDQAAEILAQLTSELALALVAKSMPRLPRTLVERLARAEVPERLSVSTPEGFSYYALHPLDYIDLLNEHVLGAPAAAIVGIRSIGTTLSAVVQAWFELHGIPAERITVRPTGHPFDRALALTERERSWTANGIQRGALFLVVDEGPGLSGSSFLAVAEALAQARVPPDRIILLPSSRPNLSSLLARKAADRWSRFTTIPLKPTRYIPQEAAQDIGRGEWRKVVFASECQWPGVWTWTERRKFLSADRYSLFRFDGHGYYGNAVRDRAQLLAEHGWGPKVLNAGDGFSECQWITGKRPRYADRDAVLQLARYCAFRAEHFALPSSSSAALQQVTQVNLERALGVSQTVALPIERPVVADAHMMPHEWIATSNGRLFKVDASSHGDDHFYPGPTDTAWDLAGAITEWRLDKEASDLLIDEYKRISRDSIETRLRAYLIAYCAFRLALTTSAERSMDDAHERTRFQRETESYRERLVVLLSLVTAA